MKKKLIVGAMAGAALLASALPVFANKPANPGCVGANVSAQGQLGTRDDVVLSILETRNLGHAIQAWKGPACGLPSAH